MCPALPHPTNYNKFRPPNRPRARKLDLSLADLADMPRPPSCFFHLGTNKENMSILIHYLQLRFRVREGDLGRSDFRTKTCSKGT